MGPDLYSPFSFGFCSVSIQSTSQFTPAQEIGNLLYVPGSYRFHTYSTTASYESKFSTADLQAGSLATGPYAQIRRELAHWEQTALGLSLGWSFLSFDVSSYAQVVSKQSSTDTRRDIYHEYVYATYDTQTRRPTGAIYDAETFHAFYLIPTGDPDVPGVPAFSPDPPPDPSKSSIGSTSKRELIVTAVSQYSLDVKFNDFGLTADWSFELTPWCQIGIAAGPTLNFLSYDYVGRTEWFLNGRRFASRQVADSETKAKAGVRAGIQVLCNLNKSGTCFLEFGGGYDWVDSVDINAGGYRAEIDASSWTGQCGMGIRF